jgi:hypothetical protein
MYSKDDIAGACTYLKSSPEGVLRKMLVGGDVTEMHFKILIKLAKSSSAEEFTTAFEAENFGKIRLKTEELALREKFWPICKKKLQQMGLLSLNETKAAA